jgi:hypothetical protein
VVEAGGKLRDTLGGLRNLEQLLRSMRVGPKGLERAIPDVHSACEPAKQAARALLARLRQALPDASAVVELESFLLGCLATTCGALHGAMGRPMNAKNRLALEQDLTAALPQLDAGIELVELLGEAAWGPSVTSPFSDLLAAGRNADRGSGAPSVRAKLLSDFSNVELDMPPGVASISLCTLLSDFQVRHGRPAGLRLVKAPGGSLLELVVSEAPGEVLSWPARSLVEPSTTVAAAALAVRGCLVTLGDEPRVFLPSSIVRALDAS